MDDAAVPLDPDLDGVSLVVQVNHGDRSQDGLAGQPVNLPQPASPAPERAGPPPAPGLVGL